MSDETFGNRGAPSLPRRPKRRWRWYLAAPASLALSAAAVAAGVASASSAASRSPVAVASIDKVRPVAPKSAASTSKCSRRCMTNIVDKVLKSMVAHDPGALPLARLYKATENSHPAALPMMTLWRTVTKAGKPSLLAIDTTNESAYFALDISEGNDKTQSVLWGRIKVVDKKITELELYVNRSRGDHGFSFSAEELPKNYQRWMNPPADRKKATRAQLESLGEAIFDPQNPIQVKVASDCKFSEEGATVIDPGPDGTGSTAPVPCNFSLAVRHAPASTRDDLVIDEKLGIVVSGATIPGKVFGYGKDSAFIGNVVPAAQKAEQEWINKHVADGGYPVLDPMPATAQTLNVLQYYNGQLQGQQVNVYLGGPGEESAWSH